jgi:hypothetical protein
MVQKQQPQLPKVNPQPQQKVWSAKQANQAPNQSAPHAQDYTTPNYGESGAGAMHSGQNLAGVPDEFLGLFEHDPSEVIMLQCTRHPIGLAGIYGGALLGIFLLLVIYGIMVNDSSAFSDATGLNSSSLITVGGLGVILLTAFSVLIAAVGGHVYKKSRLILTNQKVVFINYKSLISRQISQLNIGEVEDVSVKQPTLLHRIFKMGNLTIETAGEQHNYNFSYAENPHNFAHRTVQAHEGTILEYGN